METIQFIFLNNKIFHFFPESQDRNTRPLFENFLSHASTANRYPYLPMVKSTEVQ